MVKLVTKEKAYILGVMCGDGYLAIFNRENSKFRVRLAVRDKDFAEEFAKCLEKEYGHKPCFYFYDNRWWVETNRLNIAKNLLKNGPFSRFLWHIPSEIFSEKTEIRCAFLRGFFDSEGFANDRMIGCCSANKNGLKQIVKLLESVEIKSIAYLKVKNDGAYRLYIKMQNLEKSISGPVGN